MRRSPATILAAAVLAAAPPAQDGPVEDPAIRAKIDQLESAARDPKAARDDEAITLIRELAASQQKGLHKKDDKRVFDALAAILTRGRLRKPVDREIYHEAARGIAGFAADGAKLLRGVYDSDRFPRRDEHWVVTRAELLLAVGKSRDERSVDFLVEIARRAVEPAEAAAAGEALAHFEGSEQKVRMAIVKVLVTELAGLETESTRLIPVGPNVPQDFGPANAQARLDHVWGPWLRTLTALTGESFATAHEWERWCNEARRGRK